MSVKEGPRSAYEGLNRAVRRAETRLTRVMNDPVLARLQTAAARFQSGDFVAALGGAEEALRAAPGHPEGLHLRALALARLGRLAEAIAAYEAAARVHPQRHAVLSNLGNALSSAGRGVEAVDAFRKSVALAPGFANGWYNLGAALKDQGDLEGAIEALRKAASLEPRSAKTQNNLGSALNAADRGDEALAAYGAALAADPDFVPSLLNRGRMLRERNEFESAVADLSRAAALAPQSAEAHYQLANSLRVAGEIERAAQAYRRAIALFPQSIAAHRDYVAMLFESGRGIDAFEALDEVIAREPSPALLDLRAELSLPAGDLAGAERAAVALAALPGSQSRGSFRLARIRRNQRRLGEAAELAAKAVAAAPDDWPAVHELAETLLASRRPGEAVRVLGKHPPTDHLQKHIALLSLALRAAGDPSYRGFYDYERFAAKLFIDVPPGYSSVAAFNEALLKSLAPLHQRCRQRPIDQTLYGGTQSFGNLWKERDPAIRALAETLMATAARYVDSLPDDPGHPFLARKTKDLVCAGSWSVMLASGGGHVDHYHPQGWISASYYVKIPPEISTGDRAGFLRLGASGVDGLDLPPEYWIRPEEGAAIFFPSYMWHGVEPFSASTPRITAPFDLAPR